MKEIVCRDTGEKVSSYSEYLKTKHWIMLKDKFNKSQNKECVMCGVDRYLNIHHMTYERLGNENFDDLVYLCKDCHGNLHKAIDTDKSKFLSILKTDKSKAVKKKPVKSCSTCIDYSRGICLLGFKNKNHNCKHHKRLKVKNRIRNDEYTVDAKSCKKQPKRTNTKGECYNNGFGSVNIETVDLSKYKK